MEKTRNNLAKTCFNSIKVQLEQFEQAAEKAGFKRFQFHKGAIRTETHQITTKKLL